MMKQLRYSIISNAISNRLSGMCLLVSITSLFLGILVIVILIGTGYRLIVSQTGERHYPNYFYTQDEYSLDQLDIHRLPLEKMWEISTEKFIDRPPLYHNGIILLQSNRTIWATSKYGEKLWSHQEKSKIRYVLVSDGAVIFETFDFFSPLSAIALPDGHLLWQSSDSPRVVKNDLDNLIVVAWNKQKSYQAITPNDGKVEWQYSLSNADPRMLLITIDAVKQKVYLRDNAGTIVFNGITGTLEKRFSSNALHFPSWANSGKLYVQETTPDKLIAIDGEHNHILWEVETPRYKQFPPVFTAKTIFVGDITGKLIAIRQDTGRILWQYPSYQNVALVSNIIVVNDIVYGIFSDGRLIGFQRQTGKIVGYIQFAGVSNTLEQTTIPGIATSENELFVSLGYKKLYAFHIQ